MSGPHDSSQDTSPADQERVLCEPSEDVQSQNGDDPVPAPGSLSLFRDGGFKFPKALLEGGGFDILRNPMSCAAGIRLVRKHTCYEHLYRGSSVIYA